jgi:hypothetical protein
VSTISPAPTVKRKPGRGTPGGRHSCDPLGRYLDDEGRAREVVCAMGNGGSRLVVDRLCKTLGDPRLVAHLAADEPAKNAHIVCALYLGAGVGRRCRALVAEDLQTTPFVGGDAGRAQGCSDVVEGDGPELVDGRGRRYRLQATAGEMSIAELRWHATENGGESAQPVTVREVVGSLQSYEPVRTLTVRELREPAADPRLSLVVLRAELQRLDASPILLNRGLREAVFGALARGLTMSEIAVRCGRLKRDAKGNSSGETSWLARRIGALPEGGQDTATPWVSSDVLALVARRGLGIAPHEVELR